MSKKEIETVLSFTREEWDKFVNTIEKVIDQIEEGGDGSVTIDSIDIKGNNMACVYYTYTSHDMTEIKI